MKKLLLILLFLFASVAYAAAWVATEPFDSYSVGASISGASGGTNWTGNWVLSSGTVTTETAPAGGQGCIAVLGPASAYNANRTFTSIDDSIVHFQFYSTDATALNERNITFEGAGTARFSFRLNVSSGGRWYASDGTSYNTDLGAFSINTWHSVDIKFGHAAGKFAISFDGAAYTADQSATGGITAVDKIYFIDAGTPVGSYYVDDIGAVAGAACVTPLPLGDFDFMAFLMGFF